MMNENDTADRDGDERAGIVAFARLGFGLSGLRGFLKPQPLSGDNQNEPLDDGILPLAADSGRLRRLAAHLRTIRAVDGEMEIFIHNWARTMEQIATEMEVLGDRLPLIDESRDSGQSTGRNGTDPRPRRPS